MDGLATLGLGGSLLLLAVVGGLLGGAVGHWRSGSGGVAAGAIIGALSLPLAAFVWLMQVWMLVVGAVVLAVAAALSGFLG
jgi:hypothetical protein